MNYLHMAEAGLGLIAVWELGVHGAPRAWKWLTSKEPKLLDTARAVLAEGEADAGVLGHDVLAAAQAAAAKVAPKASKAAKEVQAAVADAAALLQADEQAAVDQVRAALAAKDQAIADAQARADGYAARLAALTDSVKQAVA